MGVEFANIGTMASPMAQSILASTGANLPALLIGGVVAGGVTAAIFSYTEYKGYQEKKHLEKINKVNNLYKEHLKQIVVPSQGIIPGFPPIFQLNKDHKYDSMHYNIDEVRDIGKIPPQVDEALDSYQESIRNAIRKLQDYYEERYKGHESDDDEITLRVISYLLNMIDTKCLSFLGYEYDIAYLGALTRFVNAYSGEEHTQHFDRLSVVYSELLEAKQKLENHKDSLSLGETVTGLKHHCKQNSDALIRTLVKMVAREKNTNLTETVNHNELCDGILRRHYINTELLKVELKSDEQIDLPKSIFKEWIAKLAKYYLNSLETVLNQADLHPSSNIDFFSFINKAAVYLKNKSTESTDDAMKELKKEVKGELKIISDIFDKSGNFTSTVYSEIDKKFHIVKDDAQLIERTKVIANFAKLTDDVISLQYLCIHLSKSIKQLGNIYFNDPTHFRKIFRVVIKLCVLIQTDLKKCQADFIALEEQNKDKMQEAKKGAFPSQVETILKSVSAGIDHWIAEVNKCRRKAKERKTTETVESANYEMLAVAKSISKRYFDDKSTSRSSSGIDLQKSSRHSTSGHKHKHHHHSKMSETNEPPVTKVTSLPTSPVVTVPLTAQQSLTKLNNVLEVIQARIRDIEQDTPKTASHYAKFYAALVAMRKKALDLHYEDNKTQERFTKATKTLGLTLVIAEKTSYFLDKTAEERKTSKLTYARDLHELLNDEDNCDYIDAHYNYFLRLLASYSHLFGLSFFNTDTRNKCNRFEQACESLDVNYSA